MGKESKKERTKEKGDRWRKIWEQKREQMEREAKS
jgi:hypothetical protein